MSVSEPVPPQNGSRAKTIAVIVVIVAFVSGALVGIVADRLYLMRQRRHFPSHMARAMTPRIVHHLDRQLQLDPEQRRKVTEILERHRERIDAISGGVRPQIRAEIEKANAEIEEILTPGQREKFGKLKLRMHRRPRGAVREKGATSLEGTTRTEPTR